MNPSNVQAPFDRAADDDFGCILFTATTSVKRDKIPRSFYGRYVVMRVVAGTGNVWYGFSNDATATINAAAAATDAGTTSQVGGVIPAGIELETHRRIPSCRPDLDLYFVRDADAAATVLIEIADDRVR